MRLASISEPWEVAAVTAVTIGIWRVALGWDWSSVPSADPLRSVAPQSGIDWLVLALGIAAGVGWLAWRDLPVAGTASIWLSIILLSGWRLGVSGILGWPIDLAALIFIVSAVCILAASAGTWLRRRAERLSPVEDVDMDFEDDVDFDDAAPVARPAAACSPRR